MLQVPIDRGDGPPVVLLHGFAMKPETYGRLVNVLSERCRVVVPDLFALRGRWRYADVLDEFISALDSLGLDRVTLIGHSFGGGIELGFASRMPGRVVELVFSDTLADSREWGLAAEALRHPAHLIWLATPNAISAFLRNWVGHPRQLIDAGLWAFESSRGPECVQVSKSGIPTHVLWANRDSILSRSDGMRFADELNATFTVASSQGGRPIDHDWMFEQPEIFVQHLDGLSLEALRS